MSGDTGNEYNHIMRSIAKVEAGFAPELVDRIERLCWGVRDGSLTPGYAAKRIVEASGIAELTEALREMTDIAQSAVHDDARGDEAAAIIAARDLLAKYCPVPPLPYPPHHQSVMDALSKIGGNQTVRHERTPAPSAEPRLLPIVKHGTAGPIYEAPKPGEAVYIGQDGALYAAPPKIGGNQQPSDEPSQDCIQIWDRPRTFQQDPRHTAMDGECVCGAKSCPQCGDGK